MSRTHHEEEPIQRGADHWGVPISGSWVAVAELCLKHGFCEQTYYRWKSKYGSLQVSEARRLRQL